MKTQDCPKFGPLQGVRVVNLTMAIAGPFACGLLADMGADVIGIESPLGRDTSRPTNEKLQGWGTQMERRNTRSLCMNVKEGEGREYFFKLLKDADILMDGFRGGQMAKWGMPDEVLWEVNPKLTIVHISGFGQTGDPAYIGRASFDGIGQAFGCFMEMNGFPDRLPVLAFPQVSDYYAGFMADLGAYVLILGPGVVKKAIPAFGLEYGSDLFPVGTPVVAFGTEAGDALEAAMEKFFSEHDSDEAEKILLECGVPCSRIYNFAIAEKDPHYIARESFTEWKNSYDDGTIRGVNIVPKLTNNPGQIWRGMPLVGADNEDILEELGATADEIAAMYESGLIKKEEGPFG